MSAPRSSPARHGPWATWFAVALGAVLVAPTTAQADAPLAEPVPQQSEAEVKAASVRAAMLFKLAGYLSFDAPQPNERPPQKQLRLGVLGNDATATTARKVLTGKQLGDAVVVVVAIDPEQARAGLAHEACDLLYIATSVADELVAQVVRAHAEKPMPTFAERRGFAELGGSVQLFVEDNGVRFEVNAEALRRQGVRASSQVLKLSRKGPRG
jgi:hypothetical protein